MSSGPSPSGESPSRVAVLDLGTNSTRLLVADVADGDVIELERRSTVTQLGRGVDHTGTLCGESIESVCDAVAEYVEIWEGLGVERVIAFATSAVRDASNGGAFVAELRERFALDATVLTGELEAKLTYAGAVATPVSEQTLACDIGGGSTELIVGSESETGFHTSLQVGTVRHTERHIGADPPTATELEALAGDVRRNIDAAIGREPDAMAERGVAVAGTPTSLAAIELGSDPYDATEVHGHRLGLKSVQRMLSRLASVPLAERLAIPGLHPGRAPTIVTGAVILVEVMRAFGLDEIEVSNRDLLHGAAAQPLAAAAG